MLRELLDQAVSCRLRGGGDVGAFLSGGLDSGAVVATAARILAPANRKIVAFTSVPRKGYDGSAPPQHIIDERVHAAATASLYPNVEHVIVPNEGCSPLANLDRWFFLADRPVRSLCSTGWIESASSALRSRKLKVVLTASYGNLGLSYDGAELLPELLASGRWMRLWGEASQIVKSRRRRWLGVLGDTFGPWFPPALWRLALKIGGRSSLSWRDYVAIHPALLDKIDFHARAKQYQHDLSMRPWKDASARFRLLGASDPGNYKKASLAELNIDFRDPTADVRLLEFCFSVPTDQCLSNGVPRALARRALADRLPKQVLEETRRGLMLADWHQDVNAARDSIVEELDRLDACPLAARTVNLTQLRQLTENWPSDSWQEAKVIVHYRYALLRAIAGGHFLRRVAGSNQ